jgi:hypothetical protein
MATEANSVNEDRPEALPVNPAGIPQELRQICGWVCWRFRPERRADGTRKWRKPPFDPRTGEPVDTTDSSIRGTFEDALAAYQRGGYSGIGLAASPGLVFGDADHCVTVHRDRQDRVCGRELPPWAVQIMHDLDSYTEFSPGGDGLHFFAFGDVPRNLHGPALLEVYRESQYLTVTGWRVEGSPPTVGHRQAQLEKIYQFALRMRERGVAPVQTAVVAPHPIASASPLSDDELIERATAAQNGEKFRRLWEGDWSGYPSQSEADLALCRLLAWWTGLDPERIDALFRRSGLYRPVKWGRRPKYREDTIALALRTLGTVYGGRGPVAETTTAPPAPPGVCIQCLGVYGSSVSDTFGVPDQVLGVLFRRALETPLDVPAIIARAPGLRLRVGALARLCQLVFAWGGARPFGLDCRRVARLYGHSGHQRVAGWLRDLAKQEFIHRETAGQYRGRQAATYVWTGPVMATQPVGDTEQAGAVTPPTREGTDHGDSEEAA